MNVSAVLRQTEYFEDLLIDDRSIIQTVLQGDREAYAELVRRYHARVIGHCLSFLYNYTDAEDAAQEIFVKAFASLPRYTPTATFLTWLIRIASNHCLDIVRKRKRQRTDSLDGMIEKNAETGAAIPELAEASEPSSLEARENLALAMRVLSELSPDERQILVLREIDGLSYEEIAASLHCTVEAVRARLRRARLEMQEKARHFLENRTLNQ